MKNQELLVKQLTALMKGDEPEVVAGAMAELGYQSVPSEADLEAGEAELEEAVAKASEEALDAYKAKVTEIVNLCQVAETPELAGQMVVSGMTVEEAQEAITKTKAETSENVISTVSSGPGESVNYLIKDAELRLVK